MKALVTGSNGFIGSHLVEALLKRGYEVRCLVRKTSNLQWIQNLEVEFVHGDIIRKSTLTKAIEGVDFIYHLAGLTKAADERSYYLANHIGTVNLLQTCLEQKTDLKKFIYMSTLAVSGPTPTEKLITEEDQPHPLTYYGKSKYLGEKATGDYMHKIPSTIIRPPVVYGPRDKDLLPFFKIVKKGIIPTLGGKRRLLSLIHVRDLVQGLIAAAEVEKSSGQTYFIAADGSFSWVEIGNQIAKALGRKAHLLKLPEALADGIALFSEVWAKMTRTPALLNRQKVLEIKQTYWICDNSKAKKELGFQPTVSLNQGIAETARWYEKMGWL